MSRLKFKPSTSPRDKFAAKIVREFYLRCRARTLSARSQSSTVGVSPKDDNPPHGAECTWATIARRCKGKVNPLWAIQSDFLRSLINNRDIAVRQVASPSRFSDYAAESAGMCQSHARTVETTINTLCERYPQAVAAIGVDVPDSVLDLLRQWSRLDAVIEVYWRDRVSANVPSSLLISAHIDYGFCPSIYTELSEEWRHGRGFTELYEVGNGLGTREPVRVSRLLSTLRRIAPGAEEAPRGID